MCNRYVLPILTIFLAVTFVPCSFAQKAAKEKPWKRFSLNLGANFATNNTSVRLGTPGLAVSVNPEELLGLETRSASFKVDGYWRFRPRRKHRLDFSWFSTRRSGENVLGIQNSIEIGGITLEPGASVKTNFDVDIFQVGYSYSFFQDDRLDLAVGVGAFIMPISFDLEVQNPGAATLAGTSESVTAPLPVFNLRADVAITPKWFLRTKAQFFYLEIGDFRGAIVDTLLAVEYMAFRNVGFGLNVENINIAVEAQGNDYPNIDFVGRFDYEYLGSMLYVKFYFGK